MTFIEEEVALSASLAHAVQTRLAGYFQAQRERARELSVRAPALCQFESLWIQAEESAKGGKKLRPALVLGTYHALLTARTSDAATTVAPAMEQSVLDVAAAFELLHTAFLLHDDVIDGDTVRRGRPNLIGRSAARASDSGVDPVSARRWGEACAVLAGDLLIHGAHAMVDRAGLTEQMRLAVQQVLDDALFVTAAGEQGDVGLSAGVLTPSLENALGVTRAKTAHYSFADPLRAAAILAGASADFIELLDRIGALIGSAFQLRDDVLGVFGDQKVTGKSVDGDLINGKVTALVAFAAAYPGASEQLGSALGSLHADDARAVLERSGARDSVERLIQQQRREATEIIRDARIPSPLQALLKEFLDLATERES